MTETKPLISQNISKYLKVAVQGITNDVDLNTPLWAINWFDLRSKRSYDFYNILAQPFLLKVKGRAHFKGHLLKKLEGYTHYDREMLLIVYYPGADSFLTMVTKKAFQALSLFRLLGVRHFVFGFTERMDAGPLPPEMPRKYKGKSIYLVHHFQVETTALPHFHENLPTLTEKYGTVLHFAGSTKGRLGTIKGKSEVKTVPFFMDGIFVIKAPDQAAVAKLLEDPVYQNFRNQAKTNSLYLFGREF
ncbi:hypothetical protein WDW89_22790 [Deltaproteobacteria bacterium TL4]